MNIYINTFTHSHLWIWHRLLGQCHLGPKTVEETMDADELQREQCEMLIEHIELDIYGLNNFEYGFKNRTPKKANLWDAQLSFESRSLLQVFQKSWGIPHGISQILGESRWQHQSTGVASAPSFSFQVQKDCPHPMALCQLGATERCFRPSTHQFLSHCDTHIINHCIHYTLQKHIKHNDIVVVWTTRNNPLQLHALYMRLIHTHKNNDPLDHQS